MEVWTAGDILGPAERVGGTSVVVKLDMPPDELPWLAVPPSVAALAEILRLTKRPLGWFARPVTWPAWTAAHRRAVRVWSGADGTDEEVLTALAQPSPSHPGIVEPSDPEYLTQVRIELTVARRHLGEVVDRYWDPGWRGAHKGGGVYPEDHLWRAARAVEELARACGARDVLGL